MWCEKKHQVVRKHGQMEWDAMQQEAPRGERAWSDSAVDSSVQKSV